MVKDLLQLKDVTKVFGQGEAKTIALKNVNLTVKAGAFTAVIGPSGSGKSTLLNIIGTIDDPTSGDYIFNYKHVDYNNEKQLNHLRANYLGFIFQNYNLLPVLSAVENVEMSAMESTISAKQLRQQAEYLLEQVGLADKMHNKPSELSGGQKQRVSVARSLMGKPKLILADEPTASLDSDNTFQLVDLMLKLNEELKTAFLFSTHDDRLLSKISDIVNIIDGKITA